MKKKECVETLTFQYPDPTTVDRILRELDDGVMSRLREKAGKMKIVSSATPDDFTYEGRTLTVTRNRHCYEECDVCDMHKRNFDVVEGAYLENFEKTERRLIAIACIAAVVAFAIGATCSGIGVFHGP